MTIIGTVFKFGSNVTTDQIIPARYLHNQGPIWLAQHCLEDADPTFAQKVKPGDVVVGEDNFGHGSSRESAAVALKAAGVGCLVAKSFGRIFFRNCVNQGLPPLVCPSVVEAARDGSKIEVDLENWEISLDGVTYRAVSMPEFVRNLLKSGGIVEYGRRRLEAQRV